MFDFFNSKGWNLVVDDKKDNVIIHQKTGSTGLTCIKAEGTLEYDLETIFKVIGNDAYRYIYDATMEQSVILEKFGAQSYFAYQKTRKIAIVSSRDFIISLHHNRVRRSI